MSGLLGTRRNPRPLAAALVTEDIFPRQQVNLDAQLALTQSIDLASPPWGAEAAFMPTIAPAVAAQFSGYAFTTPRTDGFWLAEAFFFTATYWAMWPTPDVQVPPSNMPAPLGLQADGCSFDEGWMLPMIGTPSALPPFPQIYGWYGQYNATLAGSAGVFAYVSASSPLSSRIGGPLWIPPGTMLRVADDTANRALQGSMRFRMGGLGVTRNG